MLYDTDGKISHIMALGYDITEQRENEKQQERMQNELRQAQKMESLGHLTGGIAHDFNNILGVIVGYSELVLLKYSNQDDQILTEYLENILMAGKRASKLVEQMLAFSRRDQIINIPIQLASLIKDEIKMLRSTLPSTIEIEEFIDENLPKVLLNPTQLQQTLMNLSINASDAMNGSGMLTIRLGWVRNLDTESPISHKSITGDWIELCVSDTGSGVDPEIINKIFDPFFTTKDVGKGTGMGLSVIYRIIEAHNGHILLDSKKGEGSTFRILLPPIESEQNINDELSDETIEIPEGNNSEILIVDDEEMLAMQISELVKQQGYSSYFVTDSNEALNIFIKNPDRFSLLITDQTMPKMTGVTLVNQIRQVRPDFPVIICSGYSDKIDVNSATKLNISYFDKPVDSKELLLKISELTM
ncbi:MAG: response regulator [Methylococcales bacterium]|nr:response regulator [Methylococcales bacterium]